jgi:hypothetical protein
MSRWMMVLGVLVLSGFIYAGCSGSDDKEQTVEGGGKVLSPKLVEYRIPPSPAEGDKGDKWEYYANPLYGMDPTSFRVAFCGQTCAGEMVFSRKGTRTAGLQDNFEVPHTKRFFRGSLLPSSKLDKCSSEKLELVLKVWFF